MNKFTNCRLIAPLVYALLMLYGFSAGLLRSQAAEATRPNFLFVYTDDQQWDAMSVVQREQGELARFPWLKTPNMDRLAAEGVRFRNAFVVNSLCAPSRACYLTGRYSHYNGVLNNHTSFPTNSVTYATVLRAAGYTTGYIGKWHMGKQSGQRPGFDYSASFVGQGRYFDCPFEINGVTTETKGWVDDVSADYAIGFLQQNKGKPFLLSVGFKSCHGPWDPPPRLQDTYDKDEPKAAVNAGAKAIYRDNGGGDAGKKAKAPGANRDSMIHNYMRTITGADENLGRILKTLDELKLTENTMVIFTTDNGYYLGEHGLGDKRSAYEESLRVPLLIRFPKLAAPRKLIDEITLNIDLAPTLIDYAGLSIPKEMQGRSWRALLENQTADWRTSFYYTYFYEQGFNTPTVEAFRTETAKIIEYPGHPEWTELFDVKSDPQEMRNLARDPSQKDFLTQMRAGFVKAQQEVGFFIPETADKPPVVIKRPDTFVLSYDFTKPAGKKVSDDSTNGNDGVVSEAETGEGRNGKKALRLTGKGKVEVAKSKSLDCSGGPWTVEAVVKTEQPTGVILARGGQSQGYSLYLEAGHPVFTVVVSNRAVSVKASSVIVNQWTHLAGVIGKDKQITLYVNGEAAGSRKLEEFITRDPNDSMQIGVDTGSQVVSYPQPAQFTGLIESVRVFSGERSAAQVQQAAKESR